MEILEFLYSFFQICLQNEKLYYITLGDSENMKNIAHFRQTGLSEAIIPTALCIVFCLTILKKSVLLIDWLGTFFCES